MSEATDTLPAVDENKLIAERREKLQALRAQGVAFPNDFQVADFAGDLQVAFAYAESYPAEALEASARRVKVDGRMVL
jgi:lysyl-tRNA synthetase class 2